MSDLVTTRCEGHVLFIGLNRPEKRNAFNPQMIHQLSEAYTEFALDPEPRVAVLHAHGDHFSGDVEIDATFEALMSPTAEPMAPRGGVDPWGVKTPRVPKPVIMAAQGYCLTAALELALASDIVIAAENAQFAQLEISRGLYPVGGGTTRWQLASGYQNAMRYLLTGDFFDAHEARRIGVVQDVVEPEALLDHATKMARKIAAHAPRGVRATLQTARMAQDHGQQAGADLLYPLAHGIYQTEDAKIGVATFKDKERPQYKDR